MNMTKERTRSYRIEKDRKHSYRQSGGEPKEGKASAYKRNKRAAMRAALRDPGQWMWSM